MGAKTKTKLFACRLFDVNDNVAMTGSGQTQKGSSLKSETIPFLNAGQQLDPAAALPRERERVELFPRWISGRARRRRLGVVHL